MTTTASLSDPPTSFATDASTLMPLADALEEILRAETESAPQPPSEALLDDLDAVLGEAACPTPPEVRELTERLRKALGHLTITANPSQPLARLAQALLISVIPPGGAEVLGCLRRLAVVVLELTDGSEGRPFTGPYVDRHRRGP